MGQNEILQRTPIRKMGKEKKGCERMPDLNDTLLTKENIKLEKKKKLLFFSDVMMSKAKKGEIPDPNTELKEPIAFIIKDNFDVEIRENVPEGYIIVTRKIGRSEEDVRIANPKSKLLSFPFSNKTLRGWIIDEKEAVCLPTDIHHDSLELKRIIEALILNYKNLDEGVKAKWWYWAVIAIVGIFFLSVIFNVPISEAIFGKTAQATAPVVQQVVDQNAKIVLNMMKPW
jgi:hypothetical protein